MLTALKLFIAEHPVVSAVVVIAAFAGLAVLTALNPEVAYRVIDLVESLWAE